MEKLVYFADGEKTLNKTANKKYNENETDVVRTNCHLNTFGLN